MRSKPLVLLLAMVSGALVATGAGRLTGDSQSLPETDSVEVLVAARQIDPGDPIAIEMLTIKSWPATLAPVGVISEIGLLDRQTVVMPVSAGDPILRNNVIGIALAALKPAEQSPVGMPVEVSKLQQEPPSVDSVPPPIPAGFSVVTLTLDESTGLARLVRPGDRVNVSAYFTPTEHCSVAGFQQVLRGAKVFSVTGPSFHQVAPVDEQSLPVTIALLIRTADEEAWTIAHELGRVNLSLASVDDLAPDESPVPTSNEFLAWVSARLQPSAKASDLTPPPDLAPQSMSQMTPSSGFRMLKLHGGEWTEYEVVSADRPPVMISSSRRQAEQDHAGVSSRVEGGRLSKDLAEPEESTPSWMGYSAESANPDDGV